MGLIIVIIKKMEGDRDRDITYKMHITYRYYIQ